ncbi:MAG: hypothetical protein HYY17_11400 [Planctomycetes bacterium]|nr:hypothetical protein [Planctomycetota bacterium]
MAWIGHVRAGRAITVDGKPVTGAQVALIDGAGRIRAYLPPTDADGRFEYRTYDRIELGLGFFVAHAEFVRTWGPLPPDDSSVSTFEMRKKPGAMRAQVKDAGGARVAFVEADAKGVIAVFELRLDGDGKIVLPKDPACTYRVVQFLELGGALRRVKETFDLADFPSFEEMAAELRYKDVAILRRTEREITYSIGPDRHLRFFFVPKSFDEALALVPLLDAYERTRESAYESAHEAILPAQRAGIANGVGYTAYAVPGKSLEDIVLKEGALSEGECLQLHREIGGAAAALEKRGLRHGNIAPRFVFRGPEGWRLAPPCPAVPIGAVYRLSHRLHDGRDGDDAFGLGSTLHFAATGREPQFDSEEVAPPPNVDGMIQIRERYRPLGRPAIDQVLAPLLNRA